ncbi:hypothetical protein JB92DRAFT_3126433 [Gautieria morchelliformis]|nr:hypothetical protein JB92DRAFT_3126433 [Gautieria morchelliformis]
MSTACLHPLDISQMSQPNTSHSPEDIERQLVATRDHVQEVQDKRRRRVKGGSKKAVDDAAQALRHTQALYDAMMPPVTSGGLHGLGKRATHSPSSSAQSAGAEKRRRGTPETTGDTDDGATHRSSIKSAADAGDSCPTTSSNEDTDEEHDSQRPVNKREPGPPHAILIPDLEKDMGDMSLYTMRSLLAIRKYVADLNCPEPRGVTIPGKIRQLACPVQGFLPEAALTSREVSLAFLTTSHGNVLCPLHGKYAKKRTFSKGGGATGIPHEDGYCHCGCEEDAVLFEFAMWKRWRVVTGASDEAQTLGESLRGQVMDPRMRLFVKTAYERDTGLELEDWWAGTHTQAEAVHARYHKVIEYYEGKLTSLSEQSDQQIDCALA